MDSLGDLIAKREKPQAPELLAVTRYIDEQFHAPARAAIKGDAIVISVQSAALANTLRLEASKMKAACRLEKRLIFRIE